MDQAGSQRPPRVPARRPDRADGGRDDLQRLGPSGWLERLDGLGRRTSAPANRGCGRAANRTAGSAARRLAATRAAADAVVATAGAATRSANLAATRAAADTGLAATGSTTGRGTASSRRCGSRATASTAGRLPPEPCRTADGHARLGTAQPGTTAAGSAGSRNAAHGRRVEPERLGTCRRVQRLEWLGGRPDVGCLRASALPALAKQSERAEANPPQSACGRLLRASARASGDSLAAGCALAPNPPQSACGRLLRASARASGDSPAAVCALALTPAADRSGRTLVALGHPRLEPETAGYARLGQLVRVEDLVRAHPR